MKWEEQCRWFTDGFEIKQVRKTQFDATMHLRGSEWLFIGHFKSLKDAKAECRRVAKREAEIKAGDPTHKLGHTVSAIALARAEARLSREDADYGLGLGT